MIKMIKKMMTKKTKTIYYAHCMADYGSKSSKKHMSLLRDMGLEVLDPSSQYYHNIVKGMKAEGKTGEEVMDYFMTVVKTCDCLAFRSLPSGLISAGVAKEIRCMKKMGGAVIQMPNLKELNSNTMTVKDTINYLEKNNV